MYTSIFNRLWAIARYWSEIATFSYPLAFNAPVWIGPWDNRGKCYMDRKRIQCFSNALQHVPIYRQPFLRYSKLMVENCDIFIPHLCLAALQGVTPLEFREDLDTHITRMNGLSCAEESMAIYVQPFWYSASVWQTNGQTDVQPLLRASA